MSRSADRTRHGPAHQKGVGRGHVVFASGQSHQPCRVVGQAAFAQGDDAACLTRRAEADDRLKPDKGRHRRQREGHPQQRRLQHQAQQVAASLEAVQRQVEDHRGGLRPGDVDQGQAGLGAGEGLQALGVDQVGIGQDVGAQFLVHNQHGTVLIVDDDRNPLWSRQGVQAVDLDRRAERRAIGTAQGDRRGSLARGHLRALAQRLGQGGKHGRRGQGADRADPTLVLGVGHGRPLGQDDQGRAVMSDLVHLFRPSVRRRRQHEKTVGRSLGQHAAMHHHRRAEVA